MPSRAAIAPAAVAVGLTLPAGPALAGGRPAVQLAQCTIDAVPYRGGGFGGAFSRREKPPDYLLPKKDDDSGQQSAPSATTGAAAPPGTTDKLTELKEIFDKGLIGEGEYEATQLRILADIAPGTSGVENGLRMLRRLWDQSLITPSPYAAKRKEMLDAL